MQTPCCYYECFILSSFSLLLIPLSHRNLRFLVSGSNRDRIETSAQCAQWSQFRPVRPTVFGNLTWDFFLNYILSKVRQNSEAVCTLLLSAASAITAVTCSAASSGRPDTWERSHCLQCRQEFLCFRNSSIWFWLIFYVMSCINTCNFNRQTTKHTFLNLHFNSF